MFAADEGYIPYTAVAITSIIKNIQPPIQDREKGFYFHILSDNIGEATLQKLKQLEYDLSLTYPCKIECHLLSDRDFQELPKVKGHSNYLAYYRLKFADYLPNSTQKCLYLDSDILVRADIRELFATPLNSKIVAVVRDRAVTNHIFKPKTQGIHIHLSESHPYFNSGVMLFNVQAYKEQNIAQKTLDFLKNYHTRFHDQDALNAIIGDSSTILPFKWNCILSLKKEITGRDLCFIGEKGSINKVPLTREEYEQAKQNPSIIHFTCKPWHSIYKYLDKNYLPIRYPYRDEWWEMALSVSVFKEYFNTLLKNQHQNDLECKVDSMLLKIQELDKRLNRHLILFRFFSQLWKKIRFWK